MLKLKKFLLKNIMMISFITILIVYEVFSKETPISQSWIFILLLLCPVVHIFMHKGHNRHNQLKKREEKE